MHAASVSGTLLVKCDSRPEIAVPGHRGASDELRWCFEVMCFFRAIIEHREWFLLGAEKMQINGWKLGLRNRRDEAQARALRSSSGSSGTYERGKKRG